MKKVNVLGTEYTIEQKKVCDDILLETKDGYCDSTTKSIVTAMLKPELGSGVDVVPVEKTLLRHELIHAFMYESGLDGNSEWGTDETLVDWIAIQFPKLLQAFKESDAI